MKRLLVGVLLAVLSAGCSPSSGASPTLSPATSEAGSTNPTPVASEVNFGGPSSTDADELFDLTLHATKAEYGPGELVVIEAVLTYLGSDAISMYHGQGAAHGPLAFGMAERVPVGGIGLVELKGGYRLSCESTQLEPSQSLIVRFSKSGGPVEDGVPINLLNAWFTDPDLILPAGTWHPNVVAQLSIGDCGGERHSLSTSIEIRVS